MSTNQTNNRIYISNLPTVIEDATFVELFSKYGKVIDAQIVRNKRKGLSRGFGFIGYETMEEVNNALQALNGYELEGKALKLEVSSSDSRFQNLTKDVSNTYAKESKPAAKFDSNNPSETSNEAIKSSDGRVRSYPSVYRPSNSDLNSANYINTSRNHNLSHIKSLNKHVNHSQAQFSHNKVQSFEHINPQSQLVPKSWGNVPPNAQMIHNCYHQYLSPNPNSGTNRYSNFSNPSTLNPNEEAMRLQFANASLQTNIPSEVHNRYSQIESTSRVSTVYQPQYPIQDPRFVTHSYGPNHQHIIQNTNYCRPVASNVALFHIARENNLHVNPNGSFSNGFNNPGVAQHINIVAPNRPHYSNFQPNSANAPTYYQPQLTPSGPNGVASQFTPHNYVNDTNRGQAIYNQEATELREHNSQPVFLRSKNGPVDPRYLNEYDQNFVSPSRDATTTNSNHMMPNPQGGFRSYPKY